MHQNVRQTSSPSDPPGRRRGLQPRRGCSFTEPLNSNSWNPKKEEKLHLWDVFNEFFFKTAKKMYKKASLFALKCLDNPNTSNELDGINIESEGSDISGVISDYVEIPY